MSKKDKNEVTKKDVNEVSVDVNETPLGFEDEEQEDMIIPRVKIVQAMSPERKEKKADEGDIINSLTVEKVTDKNFVPVFMFYSNILWRDRADGGGMECQARDGKTGIASDGTSTLCKVCRKNQFDNTKKGEEAYPKCTKYMNFFGFIEDTKEPMILSFAKTNYYEGKKLFSLAKVTMQNMFNHMYKLVAKEKTANGNSWFIIDVEAKGATTDEDRAFARQLFEVYNANKSTMKFDQEDGSKTAVEDEDVEETDY